ncbi:MAG: M23 family metallopeptidase [Leptospiraceae bacterium]|nr:M23 family metallopeptidase [Leptospiraceae bacterium]MCP5499917.1 M23 family metallopeptidase [Leptospiraceae bacterium]
MKIICRWLYLQAILFSFLIQPIFSDTHQRSFIWPVKTTNISDKLSSLFGESRGDHFHNGLDISSINEPVLAMEDGKILYSRYKSDSPFEETLGPGNVVWLSHGRGYLSAYYHMKAKSRKNVFENLDLKKGEKLGVTGNTGHSSGAHLHFVIASHYGKKIINPLDVLPPVIDSHRPILGALILTIGENYTYINDGDNINLSQGYPISIIAMDRGEKSGQKRGLHGIKFSLNGKPVKQSTFNYISLFKGRWVNDSGISFDELFFRGNYYLGSPDLPAGYNTVTVEAWDYFEQTTRKEFRFHVNRINR